MIAVQQIEGNVLQPILVGKTLAIHPALVIGAVALGGTLFGVIGAFLSVPVFAVVQVIARYIREQIGAAPAAIRARGSRSGASPIGATGGLPLIERLKIGQQRTEVRPAAGRPHPPSGHRVGPAQPAGDHREPGGGVGLDHVRRRTRVCRGPATACTAAYGGTLISTVAPGWRCANHRSVVRTSARVCAGTGSPPRWRCRAVRTSASEMVRDAGMATR